MPRRRHRARPARRIELVTAAAHPVNRDPNVVAHNPLGKIPTLITDDGSVLYDSRVICEYLNALGDGHLIPRDGDRALARARRAVAGRRRHGRGGADSLRDVRAARSAALERMDRGPAREGDLRPRCARRRARRTSATASTSARSPSAARSAISTSASRRSAGATTRPHAAAWFERFGARDSMVATRPQALEPRCERRERGRAPRHPMGMNANEDTVMAVALPAGATPAERCRARAADRGRRPRAPSSS